MSTSKPVALRRRHLEALRSLAMAPGGLRHGAYPSAMPALQQLGYAEERRTRSRPVRLLWHLTPAGRELLSALKLRELD